MLRYLLRRVLISVPVLFAILLLSFVFVQMLPGDPVRAMLNPEFAASPEYVAQRRAELGLDDPVFVQFGAWVREVSQGNLGYSFHHRVSVTQMIGERLWATILLTSAAIVFALVIGVTVGVIAAVKQNSLFDYWSTSGSLGAISIPDFFLGLVAIAIFAIQLGILPSGGMRTIGAADTTLGDSLRHLMMPAGVLSATLLGPYVRYTRQSMLEVLRQDYIATARAKGVSPSGVIVRHGLRNALIPLTTVLGMQIPVLLGGTVIIETIFSWPGVGRLAFQAVLARDYPIILAFVLMSALLVMMFNLLADLLAGWLDPRIRL